MILLVSVQVGPPRLMLREDGAPWRSGIVKEPVAGPVMLRTGNLAGDAQADLENHGGPDMAVLAYSAEHYPRWLAEIDAPALGPGGFGENFTISGQDEQTVCVGDVISVGDAVLQVSKPRGPCWKLARRWALPDLVRRVEETGRTGWYLRVLQEGLVAAGQKVRPLARPRPEWTIRRAREVYVRRKVEPDGVAELAAVPEIAADIRRDLTVAIAAHTFRDRSLA